ncbi:MAG: hypothetical protein LUF04_03285, partial [Bacteroides sp.]|nr:hypothetical protein [Bacteroides sp.]
PINRKSMRAITFSFARKSVSAFFILCMACSNVPLAAQKSTLAPLLSQLDKAIQQEKEYGLIKEKRISELKGYLQENEVPDSTTYRIYRSLTEEYESYICDSAALYARKSLEHARKFSDAARIAESKLLLAGIRGKAGMFNEAIDILNSVCKQDLSPELLIRYYKTYWETYVYWLEYQEGNYIEDLTVNRNKYQDSLLSVLTKGTYEYAAGYATYLIEKKEFHKAGEILFTYMHTCDPGTRDYSILTSLIAYMYRRQNDTEKQKEYLAHSALSDIKGAIKENVALRSLALRMFKEGDITRANRYIKKKYGRCQLL